MDAGKRDDEEEDDAEAVDEADAEEDENAEEDEDDDEDGIFQHSPTVRTSLWKTTTSH
jgi:hypothetical protein